MTDLHGKYLLGLSIPEECQSQGNAQHVPGRDASYRRETNKMPSD